MNEEQKAEGLIKTAEITAKALLKDNASFTEDLKKTLEDHFETDSVNFAQIKEQQSKYAELQQINGEHLSHMRKDITENKKETMDIKSMLIDQNRDFKLHRDRVEPYIKTAEENRVTFNKLGKWGKVGVAGILGIAAMIGAWAVIKGFLLTTILK